MAIAFNAATDGNDNGGSTSSLTFSHTASGSDRCVFVGFAGANPVDGITGVTYGGAAMTLVLKYTGLESDRFMYLYYLLNPATGSQSVVISASGAQYILGGAVSYTGVAQSGQFDATTTNTSGTPALSLTTSVTTTDTGCWVVLLEGCYNAIDTDPTAGSGLTKRTSGVLGFGTWGLFDSNGPATPGANNYTTNRGSGATRATSHVAASFKASAGAGGSSSMLPLLGVG